MKLDPTLSLNGGKTKPLTAASLKVLASLRQEAAPCRSLNAGTIDRLTREPNPLAKMETRANPYPSSKKREPEINYLVITDAGLQELSRQGL
jgi:hypothetical protein